jgi:hypothetical protein
MSVDVKRAALIVYATVVFGVGTFGAWQAPLSFDERRFYFPAIQSLGRELPHVPVNYALPQPPAMLVIQAVVWRVTGSVALIRALSSIAVIAAVFLAGAIVARSDLPSVLLVLMVGTFPTIFLNAWSLKQHAFTLAFLLAAVLAWKRRRIGWVAVFLALATLTNQLSLALAATFGIVALVRFVRDRSRDAFIDVVVTGCSVIPLFALVLAWHGVQPPLFAAAFPEVPGSRFNPAQVLLALIMMGFWIAPLIVQPRRWWPLLVLVPLCAILLFASGLLLPVGNDIYAGAVGPVTNVIRSVTHAYAVTIAATALLAALGVLFFRDVRGTEAWLYIVLCVVALTRVPYYFESYYALVVCVVWPLAADDVIAKRRLAVQSAYILAGATYAIVKVISGV